MELRAIRGQLLESPPPAPSGASIREWFAGLALSNPELMRDIAPEDRVAEAVRLADELIGGLASPKVPNLDANGSPIPENRQQNQRMMVRIERVM